MDWVEEALDSQLKWIKNHFADDPKFNHGWAIDYVDKYVSTKIYGYGVLITNDKLEHRYEPFENIAGM